MTRSRVDFLKMDEVSDTNLTWLYLVLIQQQMFCQSYNHKYCSYVQNKLLVRGNLDLKTKLATSE